MCPLIHNLYCSIDQPTSPVTGVLALAALQDQALTTEVVVLSSTDRLHPPELTTFHKGFMENDISFGRVLPAGV